MILAIGAQNAFVLRQGLSGEHVFWLCLFCSLSDALLIAIGVSGFGTLAALSPNLTHYLTFGGAAFLYGYGYYRFRAAVVGDRQFGMGDETQTLRGTIALAAIFTWANPHVYLDTVALIGAVSTGFPGAAQWAFAIGAMGASFVFFFSLGYGARFLAPLMRSPMSWRVLDVLIGMTMWALATMLITNA